MEPPERAGSGIGERVKAARERLGWSREELAVASALSWPAISQVESGRRRNLRPATLSSLAKALGVSADYLLHGGLESPVMLNHQALVYEGEEDFAVVTAPFVLEGVERSEAVLVVASKRKQALLKKHLGAESRRVKMVDARLLNGPPTQALSAFMRYLRESLAQGAPWVRIVGEQVWKGRPRSEVEAWVRYESLVNMSFAHAPVSILCPYDRGSLRPSILRHMYRTHPETIESGAVQQSSQYADPGPFLLGD